MNIIAKILIVGLVHCFLITGLASAHDEDTMRLISPTLPVKEKVRILAKLFDKDYDDSLFELAGFIRGGQAKELSDSLVQIFRSSGEPGVHFLSLYWIIHLRRRDAYYAIIDDALKSNNDDLRGLALEATHVFDDRRPIVIEAILKELGREPMSKLFDSTARLAAEYRLEEAIEAISRHLSGEIIDYDPESDALRNQTYKNKRAIDALNGFQQLPRELRPTLEAILEKVEKEIRKYEEIVSQLPEDEKKDLLLSPPQGVDTDRRLRTAVLAAIDKLPGSSPSMPEPDSSRNPYAFIIIFALLAGLAIILRMKRKRTG